MAKVKVMPESEMDESPKASIPPMPGSGEGSDSDSQSTFSPAIEQPDGVSTELAGDLIALPFDAWHLVQPAADPLSPMEKERLAGPFARIMEKYGLGKVAKDEILLGFYLTACIYGRMKAVHDAKKAQAVPDNVEG